MKFYLVYKILSYIYIYIYLFYPHPLDMSNRELWLVPLLLGYQLIEKVKMAERFVQRTEDEIKSLIENKTPKNTKKNNEVWDESIRW